MKKLLFLILLVGVVALVGRGFLVSDTPAPRGADADDRAKTQRSTPAFIASVTPEVVPEGTVYHVRPTRAGRLADRAELDLAWTQAVSRGVPDRAGLRQQFLCHPLSVVARAKPTWDLESWRPVVGGMRTMLQACNP